MLKRTIIYIFSAISFLNLLNFNSVIAADKAADKPAVWLKVTASGVPGSAPSLNRRISTTGNTKTKTKGNKLISNKKCPQNTGKTFGALAGGLFGSSRFKSNRGKIAGAATGAIIGAGAANAFGTKARPAVLSKKLSRCASTTTKMPCGYASRSRAQAPVVMLGIALVFIAPYLLGKPEIPPRSSSLRK